MNIIATDDGVNFYTIYGRLSTDGTTLDVDDLRNIKAEHKQGLFAQDTGTIVWDDGHTYDEFYWTDNSPSAGMNWYWYLVMLGAVALAFLIIVFVVCINKKRGDPDLETEMH